MKTLLFPGDGLIDHNIGVSGGQVGGPQPGMGIFAMMATLGTVPVPIATVPLSAQNGKRT